MSRCGATGGIISATSTNGKLSKVPAICLVFAGIETLELLRLILVIKNNKKYLRKKKSVTVKRCQGMLAFYTFR